MNQANRPCQLVPRRFINGPGLVADEIIVPCDSRLLS